MNSRSGGPAALNGFLYQLIMHLDWVEKLALSEDHAGQHMILEPHGGGDAHILLSQQRIIEQYKTRQDGGTWSIRDIVRGPFVDFVRAARTHRSPRDTFRFVTDGRVGHQEALLGFLKRYADCTERGTAVDSQKIRRYRAIDNYTDRDLFNWIRSEIKAELKDTVLLGDDVLEHVLSRVELVGGVETSSTEARLEALLRRCLPDPTTASAVRDQLVGQLLTGLASGTVDLNAKEFLRRNGIDVEQASRLANRCRLLANVLRKVVVQGSRQYRPDLDVRKAPAWDLARTPILVIAGRPGVGKTWQLARLALDLADSGLPCVFQPVHTDVLRSLDLAAQTYWNEVLGRPTTTDVHALKQGIREATRDTQGLSDTGPWLVALLDGTVPRSDLTVLIDKVAQDNGIRIAITVSPDVGERLREAYHGTVQVVQVSEFTASELTKYLEAFGIDWNELPADLFSLLKLPLLANLFVRSGHISFLEAPDSEYSLFEQLWKNACDTTATGASVLRDLARYAFEHPMENSFAVEHALTHCDVATLDALMNSGWIEIDQTSRVQFAHDRLLNWALSDAIVTDLTAGRIGDADLPARLCLESIQSSRFGYVLMDVLWKLTSSQEKLDCATKLLSLIEKGSYEVRSTDLYEHLLPTLGVRALDLLAERLKAKHLAPPDFHNVVRAVRTIGRQYAERSSEPSLLRCARTWIGTTRQDETNLGLALVEESRLVDLIDLVKAIHFVDAQAVRSNVSAYYAEYETSFDALKACVAKKPEWLREQIEATDDPEELSALAFQLLNLEHPSARSIWEVCRGRLVSDTTRARGVLQCIRRFRDGSLVDYVVNTLGSPNQNDSSSAFCVLATIAPEQALAQLDTIEKFELYGWRYQWLPELYSALPRETEQWLERTLQSGALQHELFSVISNNASEPLVKAVVGLFSRLIAQRGSSDTPWLGEWAKILTGARARVQVQGLAGLESESQLVAIAKRRVDPKRSWYDHLLEDARTILLAIGGTGIQELVKFELGVTRGRSAYRALELAPLLAWLGIESVLASHITTEEQPDDANDQLIGNHDAIVGLVAVDAQTELQSAVVTSVTQGFPLDALRLRKGQRPFGASAIAEIRSALSQASTLTDAQIVRQLILAALAQAPDLAPAVEQAVLQREHSETVFVHGAHAALQYPVTESLALWSQCWLQDMKTRRLSISLHLACGSHRSLQQLLRYAQNIATTDRELAATIISHLPPEGEIGAAADAIAIEIFNCADYAVDCYLRVARCGGREEHETLRHRAYYANPSFLDLRRGAINALATIDPLDAAKAALWLAERVPQQESFATDIVMQFGSDDHFLQLVSLCGRQKRPSLWSHFGRAFRLRERTSQERMLHEIASRDEVLFRRAFAELAGWHGEAHRTVLLARAGVEPVLVVQKALRAAIVRVDELAALKEVLSALQLADGMQAAALLHNALAVNEPFLMSDDRDDLWVGKALERLPKYFLLFALKRLSDLRKKWKPSDT